MYFRCKTCGKIFFVFELSDVIPCAHCQSTDCAPGSLKANYTQEYIDDERAMFEKYTDNTEEEKCEK